MANSEADLVRRSGRRGDSRAHHSKPRGATSAEVGVRAVSTQAQDLFGAVGTPRVIVFGAGLGGVAAGVALKRAGIETFTIFERSSSPGGT
jgi:ribulose 1,5-bisphosphate synthetase/thiazole synthase